MDFKYYLKYLISNPTLGKQISTEKLDSIFDIDLQDLKSKGIKLLVFDFDDTLADFHALELSPNVRNWLLEVKKQGFLIAVFSNCSSKRNRILQGMFTEIDFYNVPRSDKPNPAGYLEILNYYGLKPGNAAMIGDRVATDLWGAYLAGFKERILVKPFSRVFGGKKARFMDRLLKKVEQYL